ncbi:MAG: hypothetical protein OXT67_05465 [Zetaproteobacteria bacterium]|nr:hypothetical protein [Zetaproteobacteria bacterium]
MNAAKYSISQSSRLQYAGLYLLLELSESSCAEIVGELESNAKILEPILSWLLEQQYIGAKGKNDFAITEKGKSVVRTFKEKYNRFVEDYDIFSAVDLGEGEFAYSHLPEFDNDEQWLEFIDQDRWEDLRIAVAEHKGDDPIELIFMSLIADGEYGRDEHGQWDENLLTGAIWDEIVEIANTAVPLTALAYEDEGQIVSAKEVMADILAQGNNLLGELKNEPPL